MPAPSALPRVLGAALLTLGIAACGDADAQDETGEAEASSATASSQTSADSGSETSSDTQGEVGSAETGADTGDGDGDGDSTSSGDGDGDGDSTSSGDGDGDGDAQVWSPAPGATWHWQLTQQVSTDLQVDMVDLDLFDVPVATIDALRAQGIVVICYFSAGSHENWRPDEADFPSAAIGDPLDSWPGERWIDTRDTGVRAVMQARMDLANQKHCDGVEPDNVDGYSNNTGFALSAADQLDYNRFLAAQAHARDLSVGLKNDLEQVDELLADFDWALNEECQSYNECDSLQPFIGAGKAVFHVEYVDDPADGPGVVSSVCPAALSAQFSTLIKQWDLDAWGIVCE